MLCIVDHLMDFCHNILWTQICHMLEHNVMIITRVQDTGEIWGMFPLL